MAESRVIPFDILVSDDTNWSPIYDDDGIYDVYWWIDPAGTASNLLEVRYDGSPTVSWRGYGRNGLFVMPAIRPKRLELKVPTGQTGAVRVNGYLVAPASSPGGV